MDLKNIKSPQDIKRCSVEELYNLASQIRETIISHLDKEEKLFEHPELFKTPIVRNGRQATVGYCPEVWQTWE